MTTNRKAVIAGGYVVSRAAKSGSFSGVFTTVRGAGGGDVKVLNRKVFQKANAKAGKSLKTYIAGGRAKGAA